MSDARSLGFHERRARALVVADPDADPALIDKVSDVLVTAGVGTHSVGLLVGDRVRWEHELLRPDIARSTDVVVILRTESAPSREVLIAAVAARDLKKPLHALHVPGIEVGVVVDEAHPIEIDASYDDLGALRRWAIDLVKRYGHPS